VRTIISIDCVFRSDIRKEGSVLTASCGLITALSKTPTPIRVSEQACRLCKGGSIEESLRANPVLPSLVFEACQQRIHEVQINTEELRQLQQIMQLAEQSLVANSFGNLCRERNWACDVITVIPAEFTEHSEVDLTLRSIESLLEQQGSRCLIHVLGNNRAGKIAEQIDNPRQVIWHPTVSNMSVGRALQAVITQLQTEYVAWHQTTAIATPTQVRDVLELIWLRGIEMWLAPGSWGSIASAMLSAEDQRSKDLAISLVCRRATLVEMAGFADSEHACEDLVDRAIKQDRRVTLGNSNVSAKAAKTAVHSLTDAPLEPIGFPLQKVACDIVLPFFNYLDYVQQSLEAALQQTHAEVTIHLVDDCSSTDTQAFMNRWKSHPNVRCYRNRTNIGQFMSLNNISAFCDTGLIAVQDADDISLPQRIVTAGNYLRLCDADFFGGAVELFGDEHVIRPVHSETDDLEIIPRAEKRESFFPPATSIPYFLENPTAVFRRSMFQQRGGYADFGTREMNRSSLDSEFLLRCFFSGVRFAITKQVVTQYRVHEASATQNRVTGWGTGPRAEASRIVQEYTRIFRRGQFDPRTFGSLGKYQSETERI
jgi:glycosyltransferase involved in cell wall biosynthesis